MVIPKIGQRNAVYLGMILYIIGFVCFAFASKGWMMFVFIVPYCLGGLAGPALQGILSSKIPPNEQGELQGVMASMMSLASIVGPLLMTYLFAAFTKPSAPVYFPGAPFIMGAILTVFSFLLCIRSLVKYHQPEPAQQ